MKNRFIKVISIISVLAFSLSLAACGSGSAQTVPEDTETVTVTDTESAELESGTESDGIESAELESESEKDEIDILIDGIGTDTQMYSELDNATKAMIMSRLKERGCEVEFTATGRMIIKYPDGRILIQMEDSSWAEYNVPETEASTSADTDISADS